ncbi:MAG: sulfite exporter TauE/SafE family protein [Deltaproteobacteria bacterium]|nr:sulfite exporter TauE/SafE family protein [Deltaproteobacteria bacterium]
MSWLEFCLVGLAAIAGGAVNALAGGGTLITFPMLTAVGIPAVAANITNTVALCPGYLGATFAQMKDLRGQKHRVFLLLPVGVLGGIAGGVLLLNTGEHAFRTLVPFLILIASGLLAIQDPLRGWLIRRAGHAGSAKIHEAWAVIPVIPAAIYGGYFGAGLSVIVLAVLGLILDDTMTRLNALKQAMAFSINIATAIFFLFSGQIVWSVVGVMAIGALVGGTLGGRLAGRIPPGALRKIVVIIGIIVALIFFIKNQHG